MYTLLNPQGSARAKPYSTYAKTIDQYVYLKPGWDRSLARFNAYKHRFTNYTKIITLIHQSDIEHTESKQMILDIYRELYRLIPEELREQCQIMYRECLKEYRQLCM